MSGQFIASDLTKLKVELFSRIDELRGSLSMNMEEGEELAIKVIINATLHVINDVVNEFEKK